MQTNAVVVPVEFKKVGEENVLEGYAAVYGNIDRVRDRIEPKAFRKTIREKVSSGQVKLLDSHVPTLSNVLGTVTKAKETDKGLWIQAKIASVARAQDVKTLVREGHIDSLSIGYIPVNYHFEEADDGRKIRVLTEVKLVEVSVVAFPANPRAVIESVKSVISRAESAIEDDDVDYEEARERLCEALTLLDTKDAPTYQVSADGEEDAEGDVKDSDAEEASEVEADEKTAEDSSQPDSEDSDEKGDDEAPETDEDPDLAEALRKMDALLDGRDPDEVAEPQRVSALTARLEVMEDVISHEAGNASDEA